MTVKELKAKLEKIPDNYEVRFEYDGPETCCEIIAKGFYVSDTVKAILFCQDEEQDNA